jgi:hypothetical protein
VSRTAGRPRGGRLRGGRLRGGQLRRSLAQGVALIRGSDLALLYGGVVVAVTVVLASLPGPTRDAVVLHSSTNLDNLRLHPLWVLVVSAFVVSSLHGLWMVPFLALAVAAVQRWLGRIPAVFAAAVGHVGATLFVAVLIVAGISHGRLAASVAHEPDVGVSYVLACLAGLLAARVPPRWVWAYVAALAAYFTVPLLVRPTFTDLGHVTALVTGLGLAHLAVRAADAVRDLGAAPRPPGPAPPSPTDRSRG